MELKDQNWSHLGRKEKREGEGEEKRKRKKREEPRSSKPRYGTLDFWYGNYLEYGFCMDHMNFKALYG